MTGPGPLLAGTPWRLLVLLAALLGAVAALVRAGTLPAAALGPVAVATIHGGLLATALGWAAAGRGWNPVAASLGIVAGLGLAAAGTRADARFAILYLVSPGALFVLARRGRLAPVGLGRPVEPRALALGLGGGFGLAAHMLLATAGTFGYRVRPGADVLVALAYDVGANVPASELFFRGALANRLQRRYSLAVAAPAATGASLVRYLLDPQLPRAPEVLAGAVLYLSLLGLLNVWLLWRSGSVLPGAAAALLVFAAYRVIAPA
ncbi:MAG TPA: CPBP family glutamic-type intramembrane protease [Candidatus Binatia bacterium]|nr:CPBP family glutamic-type intramembrane protease [Candidatus Binatia bacterium]